MYYEMLQEFGARYGMAKRASSQDGDSKTSISDIMLNNVGTGLGAGFGGGAAAVVPENFASKAWTNLKRNVVANALEEQGNHLLSYLSGHSDKFVQKTINDNAAKFDQLAGEGATRMVMPKLVTASKDLDTLSKNKVLKSIGKGVDRASTAIARNRLLAVPALALTGGLAGHAAID